MAWSPDCLSVTALQSWSGMARALRLFANAANYPILVHCIHGKDRTGLIIMLLLMLADVPDEVRLHLCCFRV